MGIKRQLRLRKSQDFATLRQKGRTIRQADLLLSFRQNTNGHNRYGFITGKRLGNAVTRNRLRRLVRESVRLQHAHLATGYDVVFVVHSNMVGKPFDAVQRIVSTALQRAGLVEQPPPPESL